MGIAIQKSNRNFYIGILLTTENWLSILKVECNKYMIRTCHRVMHFNFHSETGNDTKNLTEHIAASSK